MNEQRDETTGPVTPEAPIGALPESAWPPAFPPVAQAGAPADPPPPPHWQPLPAASRLVAGHLWLDGALLLPAGFGWRLLAFGIDYLILIACYALLIWISGIEQPSYAETMALLERMLSELSRGQLLSPELMLSLEQLQRPALLAGWLNVAMCASYYTLFHGLVGATPGKLALRLRVLRRDGKPLGLAWALLRYLGYFLVAKLAYTAWLIPFDAQRRTLYDIVLGTNVFRQPR